MADEALHLRLSAARFVHDRATDERDAARMVRAQRGDPDAFSALYLQYFDRVYAYLRVVLRDEAEAEDATQQVFVKLLEGIESFTPGERPWRAWLFRVARNHAIDLLRRSGRVELEPPEQIERRLEPNSEGAAPALGWASDGDLILLIDRLPELQRQVVVLRYVLDFQTKEIGQVLERSEDAIRQLQSRALTFLEERLTAVGRTPAAGRRQPPLPMLSGRRSAVLPAPRALSAALR